MAMPSNSLSSSVDTPSRRRALITGKMSVGKSALINALWGRPDLLPSAARDCTQTNTLVKPSPAGAPDRLIVRYLDPARACKYALGSERWHRISEFVASACGPFGPRLDELPPADALAAGVNAVRSLFDKTPRLRTLNDHLPDACEVIVDLLAKVNALAAGEPKETEYPFNNRNEYLMGKRRPDGLVIGEGGLMAQEWVELQAEATGWPDSGIEILDTPWIPMIHDSRRVDLISRAAETCGMIINVILPGALVIEDWLLAYLEKNPRTAEKVVIVINQADTIDETRLFGSDGFVSAFDDTRRLMSRNKLNPDNIAVCAPWLANLKRLTLTDAVQSRIARIEAALSSIASKALPARMPAMLASLLQATCDPNDCGLGKLRQLLRNDSSAL